MYVLFYKHIALDFLYVKQRKEENKEENLKPNILSQQVCCCLLSFSLSFKKKDEDLIPSFSMMKNHISIHIRRIMDGI